MIEFLKSHIIAVLVALGALIAAAVVYLNGGQAPGTAPSPTPVPSVSASPSPEPTPTPVAATTVYAMIGESTGLALTAKSAAIPPSATVYEIRQVETLTPSFQGASVGMHEDPLVPVTTVEVGRRYWVEFKPTAAGVTRVDALGNPVALTVIQETIPARPSVPFYVGLGPNVHVQHGLPDNVQYQGPMIQKYAALLRDHRVEPIQQNVTNYPKLTATGEIDFNYWSQYGASFKQLILDGSIAPPMVLRWVPSERPPVAVLQAIEKALKAGTLPPGSFWYLWDEQEALTGTKPEALERAKMGRQYAPSMLHMVTWRYDSAFASLIDTFMPAFEFFTGVEKALYGSCMAQGSCVNGTVGKPSGTPMMVIDSARIHQRAYAWVVHTMGGLQGLYYLSTKRIRQSWDAGGQYDEGGNGDGTLLYKGTDGPLPSLRLKYWRQGINDLEWIALAQRRGLTFVNPVSGVKDWSKNEADYDAVRAAVARSFE